MVKASKKSKVVKQSEAVTKAVKAYRERTARLNNIKAKKGKK